MISNDQEGADGVAVDRTRNQPGVLCVRCDHLNYLGQDDCERCSGPLYTNCPYCGHKNQRVYTRCAECRRRIQRRLLWGGKRRHHKHSLLRKAKWGLFEALLVVVGLLLVGALLYFAHVIF